MPKLQSLPAPACILASLSPAEQARAIVHYIETTITRAPSDEMIEQYCSVIEAALRAASERAADAPGGTG